MTSLFPPQVGSDNGEQTGNILYTVVRERCLSRLIEVGEIGEAVPALCGRDARAPGWLSSHVTSLFSLMGGVTMGRKPETSFTRWSGNGAFPG